MVPFSVWVIIQEKEIVNRRAQASIGVGKGHTPIELFRLQCDPATQRNVFNAHLREHLHHDRNLVNTDSWEQLISIDRDALLGLDMSNGYPDVAIHASSYVLHFGKQSRGVLSE